MIAWVAAMGRLAQATDSVHAVGVTPDSIRVESPLPGGIAAFVRFFFGVPQGIQIGGLVAAIIVALAAVVFLVRRRDAIRVWIGTRSHGLRVALLLGTILLAMAVIGAGAGSWHYMQHDNDFCMGCHVMGPAFQRFTASKHSDLQCHDCHRQSIFASAHQLIMWVGERPEKIVKHAHVPNTICEGCHVTGEPEVWRRIASTAGHRTHLESDSSALADLQCVTCHGQDVHRFKPVNQTCGQSDCHENLSMKLGKMQSQTSAHCAGCHEFAAEVPALATLDSAVSTLVPSLKQCSSCHQMEEKLADFDPKLDPHNGRCGTCHNPHEQKEVGEARATCTNAGCHDDWRTEPFHIGAKHVDVGNECVLCHEPHRAKVDASGCAACHQRVAGDKDLPAAIRRRLRAIEPFDTAQALRETKAAPPVNRPEQEVGGARRSESSGERDARRVGRGESAGERDVSLATRTLLPAWWGIGAPPFPLLPLSLGETTGWNPGWRTSGPPAVSRGPPAAANDTFSHALHTDLACLTCHTTRSGHGALTFQAPRGCQICHHREPTTRACEACHEAGKLAAVRSVAITVRVGQRPARERHASFSHNTHSDTACTVCHTQPITLKPAATVSMCTDCHEDHHSPSRACAGCHAGVDSSASHAPPVEAHTGCDACHRRKAVAGLAADRQLCLTCHTDQDHYPERQCTACHLQAAPGAVRLLSGSGDLP